MRALDLALLTIALTAAGSFVQPRLAAQEKLIVGTKQVPPFSIKSEDGTWSGITVDLWAGVAEELGVSYELREMPNERLIEELEQKRMDVVLAALTITADREERIDFSHAYYASGLGIAVPAEDSGGIIGVMRRLFSTTILKAVAVLVVVLGLIGSLVGLLERRRNPAQFGGHPLKGIAAGFWWSAVTMTTVGYGDKAPVTAAGRLVALVWMFSALILISSFTAIITSSLTVTEMGSSVEGPEDLSQVRVGTVAGTTSALYLEREHISYLAYPGAPEALQVLGDGDLDALVYDRPLLRYLVQSRFKNRARVLPITFEPQPYGIALQPGSPLRERINRILLRKLAEPKWRDILYRYLG
jgi:ABC-type amino acid transport substrate-binding protein